MKKIILLEILIIITYLFYAERNYLYIFFKDALKYSKYTYRDIYYNNNFSKIDF